MDFTVFEMCFVLGFVGIGIARGYAETTEKNLDFMLRIVTHNIPEGKWKRMCQKYVEDNKL